MKQKFSNKWQGSKQARKQRKFRHNAPLHVLHKFMAANLSKDLRKKHGRKSFPLRKNDTVKVMRGKFSGKTGKINDVDLRRVRVSIEGLQIQKKDGTKINVFFHPSKLQIQEINLDDKERMQAISKERKNASEKKPVA